MHDHAAATELKLSDDSLASMQNLNQNKIKISRIEQESEICSASFHKIRCSSSDANANPSACR